MASYLMPTKQHSQHLNVGSSSNSIDLKRNVTSSSGNTIKQFAKENFAKDGQLQRIGLRMKEKVIVVEYLVPFLNKRYHHNIRLAKLFPGILIEQQQMTDQEVTQLAEKVLEKNEVYFKKQITKDHVKQLILKLIKDKKDFKASESMSSIKRNNTTMDTKSQKNSKAAANKTEANKLETISERSSEIKKTKTQQEQSLTMSNYEQDQFVEEEVDEEPLWGKKPAAAKNPLDLFARQASLPQAQKEEKQLDFWQRKELEKQAKLKATKKEEPLAFQRQSSLAPVESAPLSQFPAPLGRQTSTVTKMAWDDGGWENNDAEWTLDDGFGNTTHEKDDDLAPSPPKRTFEQTKPVPKMQIGKKQPEPQKAVANPVQRSQTQAAPAIQKVESQFPAFIQKPKVQAVSSGWDFDDDIMGKDDEVDYNSFNLNKLSDMELAKHKKKMDEQYNKNFVKPNDPNFVYDKRINFKQPANIEESWE